jgi:predicted nucleic acid-binding protein
VALSVIDTDVLIDALHAKGTAAARLAAAIERGAAATTVISVFELLAGAKARAQRGRVEKLLGALAILPIDDLACRRAADVRRELGRDGTGIGMGDCLIAGVCLSASLPLVTRNRDHFGRVPELVLGTLPDAE